MTIDFTNTNQMTLRLSLPEPYGKIPDVNVKRSMDEAKESWLWYWQDDDKSWMPYQFEVKLICLCATATLAMGLSTTGTG
jgi:hypothetical protein